jgi:hypothetical protein
MVLSERQKSALYQKEALERAEKVRQEAGQGRQMDLQALAAVFKWAGTEFLTRPCWTLLDVLTCRQLIFSG